MTNLRKSAALRLTTHHTSRLFTIPLYCHNWLIVDPFLLIPCRHACPHAIIIWHTPARPYVSRRSLAKSSLCNLCWRLHTRSGSSLASTVTRCVHASEKPHLHPILTFHCNNCNSISLVHLLEALDAPTTPPIYPRYIPSGLTPIARQRRHFIITHAGNTASLVG